MDEVSRVQNAYSTGRPASSQNSGTRGSAQTDGVDFSQTLAEAQALANAQALPNAQGIHFSNHAQKRLQKRDIQLTDENVNRLANAVDKVEKRGGKSSLVLVDDLAFIVNVQQRLVVTAMDTKEQGEGVYNQIDSVVFAAPAEGQDAKSKTDRTA